jgi:choline kinase
VSRSPSTRVVVLAAGTGSRLGATTAEIPKWLLPVGGRTIAERQLEAVELARSRTDGAIGDVQVVAGHAADELGRFLDDTGVPGTSVMANPEYATLNNWYSALLPLREMRDPDERVVIMNSDLYAEPEWLAGFLEESARTEHESLVGVDLGRTLTDESMKVSTSGDSPSLLELIGKVGVVDPVGEYVGLLMARGTVLNDFRERLESFVGRDDRRDEWYERAVGLTAETGTRWVVWPTRDSAWVEIDDAADLEAADDLAVSA